LLTTLRVGFVLIVDDIDFELFSKIKNVAYIDGFADIDDDIGIEIFSKSKKKLGIKTISRLVRVSWRSSVDAPTLTSSIW
jgi:hypothetical protein